MSNILNTIIYNNNNKDKPFEQDKTGVQVPSFKKSNIIVYQSSPVVNRNNSKNAE